MTKKNIKLVCIFALLTANTANTANAVTPGASKYAEAINKSKLLFSKDPIGIKLQTGHSVEISKIIAVADFNSFQDLIKANNDFLNYKMPSTTPVATAVNDAKDKMLKIISDASSAKEISVKSPLKSVGFGVGLEAQYSDIPLSVQASFGVAGTKLHSIGLNYIINPSWRTGISFLYASGSTTIGNSEMYNTMKKSDVKSVDSNSRKLKEKMPVFMANLQYTLIQEQLENLAPYVRLSLGMAQHKLEISGSDMLIKPSVKSKYNNVVAGLGLGVDFKISKNTAIDLSYTLSHLGSKDKVMKVEADNILKYYGVEDSIKVKKVSINHMINTSLKIIF